jgi:hypothetical protein
VADRSGKNRRPLAGAIHRLRYTGAALGANTAVAGAAAVVLVLVVVVVVVDSETSDERVGTDVSCLRVLLRSLRRHRIGVVIGAKDCGNVGEGVCGDECPVEGPLETGQVVLGIIRSDLRSLAVSRAGA